MAKRENAGGERSKVREFNPNGQYATQQVVGGQGGGSKPTPQASLKPGSATAHGSAPKSLQKLRG